MTEYIDGYYGTPVPISRSPKEYPFEGNGDLASYVYQRTYVVDIGAYVPTALGTADPLDSSAYLIGQTKPEIFQGRLATIVRIYAKIPAQQIVPTHMWITKPDIPGTFPQVFGDYLILKPVESVASYDAYTRKTVTSDSGALAAPYPSGGTYTLSFAAGTTASTNYNDNAGTVQTRLNALTAVSDRGNVVVSGGYNSAGGIVVTFSSYAAATADTTGLTTSSGFAAIKVITLSNGGYTQSVSLEAYAGSFTAGTYTLTIFGQTTAGIAYTASAATIQSALNALSEVSKRGNCTITAALAEGPLNTVQSFNGRLNNIIRFTIGFANPAITINTSLTPLGATAAITTDAVGRVQTLLFTSPTAVRTIGATAHGITVTDTVALRAADGTPYTAAPGSFEVPSPDLVQFAIAPSTPFAAVASIVEIGRRFKAGYAAGASLSRIKRVTDFYLPGITPGITTVDDIPLPVYEGDSATLLGAIFSGDTSINYQIGELEQWRGSPILQRTIVTLNAATLT